MELEEVMEFATSDSHRSLRWSKLMGNSGKNT